MKDIVYVKAEQNVIVYKKNIVLKDVAKLYSSNKSLIKQLDKEAFYKLSNDNKKKSVFSILKVYEAIHRAAPEAEIENIGECDFVVEYRNGSRISKGKEYFKVIFVCLVSFFGAAFTIMTFNEDVSVATVFDKIYQLIMGKESEGGTILEFAYAMGLPIGIIVFYNHFRRKEAKNDPTPIQVEMRAYEEEINKAMIKNESREGTAIDAN